MTYLIGYLQQILAWLLTFIDWFVVETFQLLCGAAVTVIGAIPLPSFFANAGTELGMLPPGLLYFAQSCDLQTGIPILVTAVGLRFLIRRLPFIG